MLRKLVLGAGFALAALPALPASKTRGGIPLVRFDEHVHHVSVTPVNIDADSPLVAIGEPVRQLGPRVPAIERSVEPATGATAVEAPPGAAPLIHGGIQRVGVAGIHGQIDGTRVVVDEQNL